VFGVGNSADPNKAYVNKTGANMGYSEDGNSLLFNGK
jgi:hypothetical protein